MTRRYNHASNHVIARKSIGIEFANDMLFAYGNSGESLAVKWRGGIARIRVPPVAQLEQLVALLQLLTSKLKINNWINAELAAGYFLLCTSGRAINPKKPPEVEPVEVGGLVTHSIINQHVDGGFPALYAWLRLTQGYTDPNSALARAKELASREPEAVTATDPIETVIPALLTLVPTSD